MLQLCRTLLDVAQPRQRLARVHFGAARPGRRAAGRHGRGGAAAARESMECARQRTTIVRAARPRGAAASPTTPAGRQEALGALSSKLIPNCSGARHVR